jgi:hypothetical protein
MSAHSNCWSSDDLLTTLRTAFLNASILRNWPEKLEYRRTTSEHSVSYYSAGRKYDVGLNHAEACAHKNKSYIQNVYLYKKTALSCLIDDGRQSPSRRRHDRRTTVKLLTKPHCAAVI